MLHVIKGSWLVSLISAARRSYIAAHILYIQGCVWVVHAHEREREKTCGRVVGVPLAHHHRRHVCGSPSRAPRRLAVGRADPSSHTHSPLTWSDQYRTRPLALSHSLKSFTVILTNTAAFHFLSCDASLIIMNIKPIFLFFIVRFNFINQASKQFNVFWPFLY